MILQNQTNIDLSQSCWLLSSLKSSNFDEDTSSLNFTSILLTTLNISKKVKSCVITTTKWNIIRFMVDTRHCIICLNLGYPIRLSCVRFQRLPSCYKHPLYDNIFGHLNFILFWSSASSSLSSLYNIRLLTYTMPTTST